MRPIHLLLLPVLLGLPSPCPALPPPLGFSVETVVSAAPGRGPASLTAVASCWLDGDLEAEARLGLGSVRRPDGRGADTLTPALGLRWGPELRRWRPRLGAEAGTRLAAPGLGPAPTAAVHAGIELFARRDLSLLVAIGWRWTAAAAAGAEARVGLAWFP